MLFSIIFDDRLALWKLAIINSELWRARQDPFNPLTACRQENRLAELPAHISLQPKAAHYTGKINKSCPYHFRISGNVACGHLSEERK